MKASTDIFKEIDGILAEVIKTVSSFTQEEIDIVPFEGSWTPGQVAQHIIITCGGGMAQLNGPVTDTNRPFDKYIPMLSDMFLNFEAKYDSPASARPEIRDYDKEELLDNLEAIKYRLNHYDHSADLTLTCVTFEFPGDIGYLTRMENLHFMSYHTQRHLYQLRNIYKVINQNKINQL